MDQRAAQIFTGLSVLVLLWIGVYWLWEPSTPRVSHAEPGSGVVTPDPDQRTPQPEQNREPTPALTPPEFRTHTLEPGETFESVARDAYADPGKWGVIARANPLKDPTRLRAGQTIRVPLDESNVQGLGASPDAPASAARTHIVRSGDTLSSIAERYLGSSARAREVFELNRDRLRDMHSLSVGQELRLPAGG